MSEIHDLYLQLLDNIDEKRGELLAKINKDNIDTQNENESNKTLLNMALERRDTDTALALIRKGARCDIKDKDGYTAIHWAAYFDNLDVLLELLKHTHSGFNPNISFNGIQPFYQIVKTGDLELIEFWLKIGADIHARTSEDDTILKAAGRVVSEDKIFMMRLLLKWGIGIKNDFTGVRLYDKITNGCIILNSYRDGQPITRQTPGCENAYTNLEELKTAINTGQTINIICKTSIFEKHFSDPLVYSVYKLLHSPSNSLKSKLLFFINDNPQKIKSPEFLPDTLKAEIAAPVVLFSSNNS